MKIILFLLLLCTTLSAAQVDQATDQESRQVQNNDQLQQQLPPPPQSAVERAVREADPKKLNNDNVRKAETKIEQEMERSTGKDSKNPATEIPVTPTPPALSEPISKPIKSESR